MKRRGNSNCWTGQSAHIPRAEVIASPVGRIQAYLHQLIAWMSPGEYMLLCRFASTVSIDSREHELRQVQELANFLIAEDHESSRGQVSHLVAREVEMEILKRSTPYFARGHDLNPAMQLLEDYERWMPRFTQPERNLLMRIMFTTGDVETMTSFADNFIDKRCSESSIEAICQKMQKTEVGWAGFETMDGFEYPRTTVPGIRASSNDCLNPMKPYPPFASYPHIDLPADSYLLQSGVILHPVEDGWWESGLQRVDRTYEARHHYKEGQSGTFVIADDEYHFLYPMEDEQEWNEHESIQMQ